MHSERKWAFFTGDKGMETNKVDIWVFLSIMADTMIGEDKTPEGD